MRWVFSTRDCCYVTGKQSFNGPQKSVLHRKEEKVGASEDVRKRITSRSGDGRHVSRRNLKLGKDQEVRRSVKLI